MTFSNRRRRFVFFLGSLCGLAVGAWSGGPSSAPPKSPDARLLPPALLSQLDQEYPGWTLSPVNAEVQKIFAADHVGHPPCVIWGDFNHDGAKDYGVQIALTEPGQEEQIAIGFVARHGSYEETVLESRGLDPAVFLWVRREASSSKDVFVVKGGPAGESVYSYAEGSFHEELSAEAQETPRE